MWRDMRNGTEQVVAFSAVLDLWITLGVYFFETVTDDYKTYDIPRSQIVYLPCADAA